MPIHRRTFIASAGAAASIMIPGTLKAWPEPPAIDAKPGYQLKIMATNWGFEGSAADFCKKAKRAGYDGIEVWMPEEEADRRALQEAANREGLDLAFLYGGGGADYARHAEQFKKGLNNALSMKPLYMNCHSGKDYFSFEQNRALIDYSLDLSAKSGIPVYHETHRGRSLFAAHTTKEFIDKIPSLRLTLDISHWCNVHESLLGDQQEVIKATLSRTDHIHARIGHAEGPQVHDPRAPECEPAMKAHLGWWDQVVQGKKKEGRIMTILTEFGPPDYMPVLPYTRQPVASQWDINEYMMHMLRKRYAS